MRDESVFLATRREFFLKVVGVAAPLALLHRTACAETGKPEFNPTPAVGKQLELTEEEMAGPFFRPNSPLKNDFREAGVNGEPIELHGLVLDRKGKSIPGVLLDFWHADGDGKYDFETFRCRGHQFTDAQGSYHLQTVVPGFYPGRTRHFHVRFQAARSSARSTQLYFPGEQRNATDALFRPDLLIQLLPNKRVVSFNFVVDPVT
jgi:protocatechuate 3,4-dioxygenase beta subunit